MTISTIINTNKIPININHHSTCDSQYVPSEFGLCQNEQDEHLLSSSDLQCLIDK